MASRVRTASPAAISWSWRRDGLVDVPSDEGGGALIRFDFDYVVDLDYIVLIDVDLETVEFELTNEGIVVGTGHATDLGNNSAQVIDLTEFLGVTTLEISFSGSGGIAELEFHLSSTPAEQASWGFLKGIYR